MTLCGCGIKLRYVVLEFKKLCDFGIKLRYVVLEKLRYVALELNYIMIF